MTSKRPALDNLPQWPRGLSLEQAAAYCGMSPNFFKSHVLVDFIRVAGRVIYDRASLDAWFDRKQRPTATIDDAIEQL